MPRAVFRVGGLLFLSGMCSLIYETVWLRELRLVLGASTMASAAVVACFVGGLGAGGLLLGKRADRHPSPLTFYGNLEATIAVSAAITPGLLTLVRVLYVATGGSGVLGVAGGSAVRVLLSALVFAVPTLAMGGTLPAVARAVEEEGDRGRRLVALLYGVNTLGAVVGCALSTFLLFEVFGTRLTLWLACLVNGLVAVMARAAGRSMSPRPVREGGAPEPAREAEAPTWLALAAAAGSGFAFCLMELVWYRMLAPLLGGSVFTFGLILAVALFGIGVGGLAYSLLHGRRPATVRGFAWTCLLEAAFMAIPYALGDRIAVMTLALRPLGTAFGFGMQVLSWSVVVAVVVLPPALISGFQFPLLIGLLGEGTPRVGRDVGLTYALNTVGAVIGSLAGGFGLLPALTAPGCWRFVTWLLVSLGVAALGYDLIVRRALVRAAPLVLLGALVVLAVRARGPTAVWRHSPIGAGRVSLDSISRPILRIEWEHDRRRRIAWEADGRESSVAIDRTDSVAFVVNGKIDGNSLTDAATAVMSGLVPALEHPTAKNVMVIGLGTGETAGWLAAVPSITDVDVAELEPAILEIARRSTPLNQDALSNPKVHIQIGDAREVLLTSRKTYDLIASEPSNPYRAGVASLFTQEYYRVVASHLAQGGLFMQWMQAYEIDGQTLRTVYATLASVFPYVESWELEKNDLGLVASMQPIVHDTAALRAEIAQEPFRTALARTWRVVDLEGVLAHFIAGPELATKIAEQEGTSLNTDDLNQVEFGFARSLGIQGSHSIVDEIRRTAYHLGTGRAELQGEPVDWGHVDDERASLAAAFDVPPSFYEPSDPDRVHRVAALEAFVTHDLALAAREWSQQSSPPIGVTQLAAVAQVYASLGRHEAELLLPSLREFSPGEADAVLARLRLREGKVADAADALEAFFLRLRTDPWVYDALALGAFDDARRAANLDRSQARRLWEALREPFAALAFDAIRADTAFAMATALPPGPECVSSLAYFETDPSWNESFLRARYTCYLGARSPLALRAQADLLKFFSMRRSRLSAGLD